MQNRVKMLTHLVVRCLPTHERRGNSDVRGPSNGRSCDEDAYDARSGRRCAAWCASLYGGTGRSLWLGVREQLLQDGCLSPSGVRLPALQSRALLSRKALLPLIEQLGCERPTSA